MSFLRLGAACVVLNDEEQILLARRGDLNVWNLPSGRLDSGESFQDAAIREVFEETGAEVELLRPAGLYYTTRWNRLTMVFLARMVGGELKPQSAETLENRFFTWSEIPHDLFHAQQLRDSLIGKTVSRVMETNDEEYARLRRTFAMRWVKNLISGNPEPRYPQFTVNAVGLMWDPQHLGVLNNGDQLPRVTCDGESAPWDQLAAMYMPDGVFEWVGLYQDPANNLIEFIFSTTVGNTSSVTNMQGGDEARAKATRIVFKENPFSKLDTRYIDACTPDSTGRGVWMLR
ncbi:MAG: NUDIX hydrolase [Aggregatilineales bacterium]